MERTLMERVNPVFKTAKMTLGGLAMSGDSDAVVLSEKLGLAYQDLPGGTSKELSDMQALSVTVLLEIRFGTVGAIADETGCKTIVDLPCGYTPRGLKTARKNQRYVGLDLPATVSELEGLIIPMISDDKQSLIRYRAVDATNYASLESALEDVEGPICVTTEGLLMYFNDSEAAALCENIRRLLTQYGGCWVTSDPEMMIQNTLIMQAIAGERYQEIVSGSVKAFEGKADIHVDNPVMVILPWNDVETEKERALAFLSEHGLKAERLIVGRHMPKIRSMSVLTKDVAEAINEGMEECAYWKITLSNDMQGKAGESVRKGFEVRHELTENTLRISIIGRIDTLTAPEVLKLYEKISKDTVIDAVCVDCSSLDYISSAGLRVLLIMHKACKGGVVLDSVNSLVQEILNQTGFDSVFCMGAR